jgi:hypothetical protein
VRDRHRLLLLVMLFGAALACRTTRPPLVFSPRELPEAQVGRAYEATIAVSGNETPVFLISVESEELPPGLTLEYEENASTAAVIGVPERAGEYEFTVHASCYGTSVSGQTGEQRYRLLVKQE